MKKIIMTGGGTAGHVTPNLALVPLLKEKGYEIFYIGSYTGIEKKLVEDAGITYYGISSGKLRRYHDWKNFTDPFRVIKGFSEANQLMKHIQPDVVFSKGGFVSVPVVMAAARQHIPAIIHESDMTPGLANKLAIPFASKVCCNFPETMQYLPDGKAVHTGSPIRKELFSGNREAGLAFTGFSADKPVILIMGGSIGSRFINNAVWSSLDTLLEKFQIVHLVGKGNINNDLVGRDGYKQYEFISEHLNDIFAMTDLMISRAGANSISEILALKIPNILIPLPAAASRGDQILNAASYKKQGFSTV
ncbi:MAG: undecaprenyldiphospho-muramoylpentapeptide beta-N-acetylglucosaminyltransferase, partial [Pseudobutyrivibrio sp.]|uniref:undecaprenyldiphospho-muramoylpentapeptide beta-N-acetylglucosaminyltransferase n=1 Tax=Pseudobutyrivibrio sp. TaxID=2014367 RepID=UPI0025FC7320